jgi:hypothetical protein
MSSILGIEHDGSCEMWSEACGCAQRRRCLALVAEWEQCGHPLCIAIGDIQPECKVNRQCAAQLRRVVAGE